VFREGGFGRMRRSAGRRTSLGYESVCVARRPNDQGGGQTKRSILLVVVACAVASLLCAAPALAYDCDNAASWADIRWNDLNDWDFPGYIDGADCTNYASGAIFNGGVQRDGSWYCYRIGTTDTYNRSTDWVDANHLRTYFWGKSGISEVGSGYNWYGYYGFAVPQDDIAMIRGDVVSCNTNKNEDDLSDHTEFGVGVGQSELQNPGTGTTYYGDLIDQRNSERHHAIWHCRDRLSKPELKYWVFRVWHISNSFTN